MAVRSKSSKAWLHEHVNDHYVHMAQKDGYRARAAYKLLEINEKRQINQTRHGFGGFRQRARKLVTSSSKTGRQFRARVRIGYPAYG